MPCRLIINADDFGLTSGINRVVLELHCAGAITSATLMATGPAFDEAVAIARATPSLGVGCHLVFTDGIPVSPPQEIPSLLGPDGKTFRPSALDFAKAVLRGQVQPTELALEALAQIQRLQRADIAVTHIDTHKHTHLFPLVAATIFPVAQRCGIASARNPFEPAWASALSRPGLTRRIQLRLLNRLRPAFNAVPTSLQLPEGTLGIAATGTLDALTLRRLLANLPGDALYELCCHPGYNDAELRLQNTRLLATREVEREALLAVIPEISLQPNAPSLIHYGNLATANHGFEKDQKDL